MMDYLKQTWMLIRTYKERKKECKRIQEEKRLQEKQRQRNIRSKIMKAKKEQEEKEFQEQLDKVIPNLRPFLIQYRKEFGGMICQKYSIGNSER